MPDGDAWQTRVSTKGQVILPKTVRDRHGWGPGTVLDVKDGPNGVVLTPARFFPLTRPEQARGALRHDGPPVSLKEMDDAITAEVVDRHARGRY